MFLFEMNHLYSQTQFSGGKNGKYIAKKALNAETNVTWVQNVGLQGLKLFQLINYII